MMTNLDDHRRDDDQHATKDVVPPNQAYGAGRTASRSVLSSVASLVATVQLIDRRTYRRIGVVTGGIDLMSDVSLQSSRRSGAGAVNRPNRAHGHRRTAPFHLRPNRVATGARRLPFRPRQRPETGPGRRRLDGSARVAQLVERRSCKAKVSRLTPQYARPAQLMTPSVNTKYPH